MNCVASVVGRVGLYKKRKLCTYFFINIKGVVPTERHRSSLGHLVTWFITGILFESAKQKESAQLRHAKICITSCAMCFSTDKTV